MKFYSRLIARLGMLVAVPAFAGIHDSFGRGCVVGGSAAPGYGQMSVQPRPTEFVAS